MERGRDERAREMKGKWRERGRGHSGGGEERGEETWQEIKTELMAKVVGWYGGGVVKQIGLLEVERKS